MRLLRACGWGGVLLWRNWMCKCIPVLEWLQLPPVPPVDSAGRLRGFFRCLWGSWLRSSCTGSLVFRRLARKTGLSVHWVQARWSTFSLWSWQPTSEVPLWALNGSTYGNSAVWYFKSPLPSCPRFAVCRYWQLNIPSLSLRPQLEGSLARSIPVLLSVSALSPVSPSCRLRSNPDPQQLLLDKWNFYLNQGLAPSTRKVYASAERRFLDFYAQDNSLPFWGSALPASEDVLIHFYCHLADYLSTIYPLPFSNPIPSHQGGSAFSTGWLPSVTAGVSAYQTSPRLK